MKTKKQKLNKDLFVQKLGEKTVILDSNKLIIYTLNETGSLIFQKAKAGFSIQEIVALIGSKYQTNSTKLENDVSDLILSLKKNSILV